MCRQRSKSGDSDQAYVTVQGARHYLGPWGSQQAAERYGRTIGELLSNGGHLAPQADDATVTEACAAYLLHCEQYYGRDSSNVFSAVRALRNLKSLYGTLPVRELKGQHLLTVQASFVADGLTRRGVNRSVNLIRQMVRWGISRDLIPESVLVKFECLAPLRRGHTTAPDNPPVRPVAWEHVVETLPYLTVPVAGLVMLAWLTGARIGELTPLRARDIETNPQTGKWEYRPQQHKNAWRGQERTIPFGPLSRWFLEAFIERRGTEEPLFSPRDALQERAERALTHRRENQAPNPKKTDRGLSDAYDSKVVTRSIRRAVEELNKDRTARGLEPIARWHVHQCRHSYATRAREVAGIEGARISMGHRDSGITEQYAERDLGVAREIADLLG